MDGKKPRSSKTIKIKPKALEVEENKEPDI